MPIEQPFRLPATLTIDDAEAMATALAAVDPSVGEIHVDLTPLEWIAPAAAARISSALRPLSEKHAVAVTLPESLQSISFSSLIESPAPQVESLVQSGMLHALTAYASVLRSGSVDVTAVFRDQLSAREIHGRHYYFLPRLHAGTAVNVNDFDTFAAEFRRWEERLPRPLAEQSPKDFQALAQLCFEAIQNIYDHAGKSPLPARSNISSFFSLTFHESLPKNLGWHISGYLRRYAQKHIGRGPSFIEILVADNGVGIPARQSGTLAVYSEEIAKEVSHLEEALRSGGSIKLRSLDSIIRGDPGYGYTKIDASIVNLGGWASLRTGRLNLVMDSTRVAAASGRAGFRLAKAKYGYDYAFMPGTILQVVIPLAPTRQARFKLI